MTRRTRTGLGPAACLCVYVWACGGAASASTEQPAEGAAARRVESGATRLEFFESGADGYGIALRETPVEGTGPLWSNHAPAAAEVLCADGSIAIAVAAYAELDVRDGAVVARARLPLPGGGVLAFRDVYRAAAVPFHAVQLERTVSVEQTGDDRAFLSRWGVVAARGDLWAHREIFMPGVWYGRNEAAPEFAIGGDPAMRNCYVREDRLGAPMLALRDARDGATLELYRAPEAVPHTIEADKHGSLLVDERLAFGALGVARGDDGSGPCVAWLYPGAEYNRTYIDGTDRPGAWRMHPLRAGLRHETALCMRLDRHEDFTALMGGGLERAWALYRPRVRTDIPLERAWSAMAVTLREMYQDYGQPMTGVPTGGDKMTGTLYDRSVEMGFLGPQIRMAASLLDYAARQGDARAERIAVRMLDNWADQSGLGLAHTRWSFSEARWVDDGRAGEVYLRRQAEGHLHMLEALRADRARTGDTRTNWRRWALSLADWLLEAQREDGSWARKYRIDGVPILASGNATAWPIPYLCAAWIEQPNQAWLDAASRAGDFIWREANSRLIYAGGPLDYSGAMDKEATLASLEAYLALHEATGEPRWLARADHAALVGMSWHYLVDLPNPLDNPDKDWHDADTTVGIGLIALGHSGADIHSALNILPYARLYQYTGRELYDRFARLLLYNTKQPLDLDETKGYALPGLMSEVWTFSINWNVTTGGNEVRGIGHRFWVPWTTANSLHGLTRLLYAFGGFDWPRTAAPLTVERFECTPRLAAPDAPATLTLLLRARGWTPPADAALVLDGMPLRAGLASMADARGLVNWQVPLRVSEAPDPTRPLPLDLRLGSCAAAHPFSGLTPVGAGAWSLPPVWAVPAQAENLAARAQLSASYSFFMDSLEAVRDGIVGDESTDKSIPRHSLFAKVNTVEWIEYAFDEPAAADRARVFWYHDVNCREPDRWWVEAFAEGQWQPVRARFAPRSRLDVWNELLFEPTRARRFRLYIDQPYNKCVATVEWQLLRASRKDP